MKILYAIQGTGNGHLSRAREIIPILRQFGELDIFVSGTETQVNLPYEVKYKSKGLSLHYDRKGGMNLLKTIRLNPPTRVIKEVREFPVEKYDIVINDFEPISAWACKLKNINCVALSHQSAFLSPRSPRPKRRNFLGEFVLNHYAPTQRAIGFHFQSYDDFIYTPVIRKEIREADVQDLGHYTVYLQAMSDSRLLKYLHQLSDVRWEVFSRYTKMAYRDKNVWIFPVNNDAFVKSFITCSGILTAGGFETPAEALHMGKKLFVSPIKGQYEQYCNAEALRLLGVPVVQRIDEATISQLRAWAYSSSPIQIIYPDKTIEALTSALAFEQSSILSIQ